MIRPFTITCSQGSYIDRYYIQNHRGDSLTKNKKIVDGFFQKLLTHPITAFAYKLVNCGEDLNPKFDRADVIKAIDFCIQYFVYQNKVDYIIENTVNKDFEVTIRELVETREAVLKEKADTKFVRKKFGSRDGSTFEYVSGPWYYYLRNNKVETNMPKSMVDERRAMTGLKFPKPKRFYKPVAREVEYTEEMCNFSTQISYGSEQFCYKVKQKTILNRKITSSNDNSENFRLSPFTTSSVSMSRMLNEMAANHDEFVRGMRNTWTGLHRDSVIPGYLVLSATEIADHHIIGIDAGHITSNMNLTGIQRWQRTRTVRAPAGTILHTGDILQLQDATDGRTLARGRVVGPIVAGDLIMFAQDEWTRMAEAPVNSTVYENVVLAAMNNAAGDLQVTFNTNGTRIDMTLPEAATNSFVDHVTRRHNHTVRIERRTNQVLERVEVDHRVFPVRSLRIRQGHRDPLSDPTQNFLGRERALQVFLHPSEQLPHRFPRMTVTETSIGIGEHVTQELTFYDGARTYVKLTIQDPAAMIDINNNGFCDITFPGGGRVAINGINYNVPDDRVEVVTR